MKHVYDNETSRAIWITFEEAGKLQEEFIESHKWKVDEVSEKESQGNQVVVKD